MPAPKFVPPPYPPLDGLSPGHPWQPIHQWLCHTFGAHPDQLVVTDPGQNFHPVVDLEPLMVLLGGAWERCAKRCHEVKASTDDKRTGVVLNTGDAKDGSFLADAAARGRAAAAAALARGGTYEPTPEARCIECGAMPGFIHDAGCRMARPVEGL